jgi:hypothetical protein
LGSSDGHFIDCREETSITFLAAFTRVSESILTEILNTLSYLKAIDRDLWRYKLVYCQHFVDNVADAYKRRKEEIPSRETVIAVANIVIVDVNPVNADDNPQTKVNDIILNDSKEKESKVKRFVPPSAELVLSYMQEIGFNGDAQHFVDYYTGNGWKVGKNKMVDWKATVRTWRKNDNGKTAKGDNRGYQEELNERRKKILAGIVD